MFKSRFLEKDRDLALSLWRGKSTRGIWANDCHGNLQVSQTVNSPVTRPRSYPGFPKQIVIFNSVITEVASWLSELLLGKNIIPRPHGYVPSGDDKKTDACCPLLLLKSKSWAFIFHFYVKREDKYAYPPIKII